MFQIYQWHPAAKLEEKTRFKDRQEFEDDDKLFEVQKEILDCGLNTAIIHVKDGYVLFVEQEGKVFQQR